jgi:hypothetical protein
MKKEKKKKFWLPSELNGRLQDGISFKQQIKRLENYPPGKWALILEVYGRPVLFMILCLTLLWFYLYRAPLTMGPNHTISLIMSIIMGIFFLRVIIKIYKKQWTFFRTYTD